MVEIRSATKADIDVILQLWQAAEASTTATDTPKHLQAAIDHPAATVHRPSNLFADQHELPDT
jgi:hypothetical protein